MSGNSYDLTMMRSKKSFKWLTTMVGIALLVVLLASFQCFAGNGNKKPKDITLSSNTVDENQDSGMVVGTFTTTGGCGGCGGSYTYSLVEGNDDNDSFNIEGAELQTAASFDYETKDTYKIRVESSNGGTSCKKKFTITVTDINDAPTDISLDNSSVAENQPPGTAVGTFTTTDQDSGDSHTYSLVSGTGDDDNGSFNIVGDELQTAASFNYETKDSYSIRVQTDDSHGSTYEKQFTITVTDVNEAPTDISLDNSSVAENQRTGAVVGTFTTTDGGGGPYTYTYSLVEGKGDDDNGSFNIVGDELRTAASFDYETKDTTYKIRVQTHDSHGGTYEKQFTITVTDVNDTPTDISLDNSSVAENQRTGAVVGTFTTTDGGGGPYTYTYSLVKGKGDNDNGSFNIVGDKLQTAASFNYKKKDTYKIRVQTDDSHGGTYKKKFTVTVTDINYAPVAVADSYSTDEDTKLTVRANDGVLANDTDEDGDRLTATLVTDVSNGTLTLRAKGTFTYTPADNFNGSDSFTYTVKDNGGATSNVATVTINVGVVNDALVANDDSDTTPEDTPVSTNVVTNDTDVDGTVVASTVAIVSGPRNGSVVNNGDGTVTYTPNANFYGSDSFTYTVKDNGGATSNVAIVTINVGAVNDPPVAQMDSAITDENMPVTIPVLVNDSDLDGDRLTVESVTQHSNGTVTNNGTDVTYSPDPDFNGMDTFTYTVSDKNGSADTARVSVEVLEGAADGEGGAYGPSEGKVKLGELVSQVRFVKRDTDNISWLVPGVPNLTVLEDSMVLEKLALSTDLQPTEYRAGAHLEVGVELPTMEERRAHGWPWIRVTSPDLAEPGNVTAGFSFSGRSADGIYWFGIDIGDVPWGRYDFWIVYGEEKMMLVPIIVSP